MKVETEFSLKKKNEEINQDAYAINVKNGIFGIADGVSQSPFSSIWSKKIVTKFVNKPFNISEINSNLIHDWLDDIQKEWMDDIQKEKAHELIIDMAKENGGSTTFLGGIFAPNQKTLDVCAIGDSNLFILRKNRIIESFPITTVEKFTDQTLGVFSIKKPDSKLSFTIKRFELIKGDSIILATDALAKWILNSSDLGQKPWNKILKNKNSIEKFIDELRATNKIDDDDTTCVILQI
jgi:serine/threonine protein phosphatase PrpC